MTPEQYDRLVRAIYEGVLAADSWQSLLPELRALAKAEQAVLLLLDRQSNRPIISNSCGSAPEEIKDYEENYAADDPGRHFIGTIPTGGWYFDVQALDRRLIQTHPFYQEFMRSHGLGSLMWTPLLASDDVYLGLSFIRAHGHSSFQPADTTALLPLLPHLAVAAKLRWKFETLTEMAQMGQDLLDRLAIPVLVVEKKARILFANRAGQNWLSSACSPFSQHSLSKQVAPWPYLMDLAKRICGSGADTVATLRLPEGTGKKSMWLVGFPLHDAHPVAQNWREPVGIIVVHDLASRRPPWPQLMRSLFGLTPAECRLVQQLTLHHSTAEAAESLAVGRKTVKSQLKSIFGKTGINSQSALMQLITEISHLPLSDYKKSSGIN